MAEVTGSCRSVSLCCTASCCSLAALRCIRSRRCTECSSSLAVCLSQHKKSRLRCSQPTRYWCQKQRPYKCVHANWLLPLAHTGSLLVVQVQEMRHQETAHLQQLLLQTTEGLSELDIACCSPCWLSTSWLLARFTVSQLGLQPARERAKSPEFFLASVALPVEVRLRTPCCGRCSKGDLGIGRPLFSVQGFRRREITMQASKRALFSEFGRSACRLVPLWRMQCSVSLTNRQPGCSFSIRNLYAQTSLNQEDTTQIRHLCCKVMCVSHSEAACLLKLLFRQNRVTHEA